MFQPNHQAFWSTYVDIRVLIPFNLISYIINTRSYPHIISLKTLESLSTLLQFLKSMSVTILIDVNYLPHITSQLVLQGSH